jgi:hypothetical protein
MSSLLSSARCSGIITAASPGVIIRARLFMGDSEMIVDCSGRVSYSRDVIPIRSIAQWTLNDL